MGRLRGNFGVFLGFWPVLIGRQEIRMKIGRDLAGGEERGPESKAKRTSLRVESHVMNNAMRPVRITEESFRGRRVKTKKTGERERNLSLPLGILEAMKRQYDRERKTVI